MKLDELDKIKVRKAASDKVRATLRHEDRRRKSRAAQKRQWKREAREALQ